MISTSTMQWLDWVIVFLPLLAVLYIGYRSERYVRGVSDFLAAGRKAGRYLLTVSDGTAGMGLISLVAVFEQNYKAGFALGFWSNFSVIVSLLMTLTGFVIYRFRETRSLTMAEFFQKRYSRGFRIYAGVLAFISGLINYALFPAVGARFMVYYCGLPFHFNFLGITWNTYVVLLAFFLGIALLIVLVGGQITTMVTDCCQGIFAYFGYTIIVICLLYLFSVNDVQSAVMARPKGMSFFNPFNIDKLTTFNLLYVLINMFAAVYNCRAWLGSQAYMCCAANPHEQKMAGVLAQWRAGFQNIATVLLCIGAFAFMNANIAQSAVDKHSHIDIANNAKVNAELDQRTREEFKLEMYELQEMETGKKSMEHLQAIKTAQTIRTQMLVPVALRHILPIGATGILCALMLFLMVSTDTTYMHSWGTILVQDVILPIWNRPISPKAQIFMLRAAIAFIAIFAMLFSIFFQQSDYILQFFALTGTIFLGGAGACILGGLYWKRGTTAGAYVAMTIGLIGAIIGFVLNQKWGSWLYPYLSEVAPGFLESFRTFLANLGDALPIVQWETAPDKFAMSFPITAQELYFSTMLCSLISFVVVSLITCKVPHNMDKLLHRGEYNVEHFVSETADARVVEAAKAKRWNWRTLVGITPEYSKGDRIIAWSVFWYVIYNFAVFLVQLIMNVIPATKWAEITWFKFWLYYTLPYSLIIGLITTIWFTWGSTRDLIRLFRDLRESYENGEVDNDSGQCNTDAQ